MRTKRQNATRVFFDGQVLESSGNNQQECGGGGGSHSESATSGARVPLLCQITCAYSCPASLNSSSRLVSSFSFFPLRRFLPPFPAIESGAKKKKSVVRRGRPAGSTCRGPARGARPQKAATAAARCNSQFYTILAAEMLTPGRSREEKTESINR